MLLIPPWCRSSLSSLVSKINPVHLSITKKLQSIYVSKQFSEHSLGRSLQNLEQYKPARAQRVRGVTWFILFIRWHSERGVSTSPLCDASLLYLQPVHEPGCLVYVPWRAGLTSMSACCCCCCCCCLDFLSSSSSWANDSAKQHNILRSHQKWSSQRPSQIRTTHSVMED